MKRRKFAVLIMSGLLAQTQSFASDVALPPPYQGAYQPHGPDEIGLWRQMDEEEKELSSSELVIRDEALVDHVHSVLCNTVGFDRCKSARIYIIRNPVFNASMNANGTLRVFTGLLLRVQNDAQLGAVLGHEFAHFEKRHALEKIRRLRSAQDFMAWASVLFAIYPTYSGYRNYHNMQFAVYGNLFRYERDQERDADLLGLQYLNNSHYSPIEASVVWSNYLEEGAASAEAKGLKKPDPNLYVYSADHPPIGEREDYLKKYARPTSDSDEMGDMSYQKALEKWLPQFLDDTLKINDFGSADFLIELIAKHGWKSWLWEAKGELYRFRGAQRDLVNAVDFYGKALEMNPTAARSLKGLGISLVKLGRRSEARTVLERYVSIAPEASDITMIKSLITQVSQ